MIEALTPRFVEAVPERLDEGVLYVCEKHRTALHRCCCGCGREVVTPLGPAGWVLRMEREAVTLHPSIGNWGSPCQSHYWIRRNRVVPSGAMSTFEINQVRMRDQRVKATYIESVNRQKDLDAQQELARATDARLGWTVAQWVKSALTWWWIRLIGRS